MRNTAWRITVLTALLVSVGAAAASGQSSPPAPAPGPAAPAPAPPETPAATDTHPYTVNVALTDNNRIILTDAQGMTLYYRTNAAAGTPLCTGACTALWPPALASGTTGADVSAAPALSPMTVVSNPNGAQLAYHGHLLYRYSKDTAPGQMTGDRVIDSWGTWAVATPDLPHRP